MVERAQLIGENKDLIWSALKTTESFLAQKEWREVECRSCGSPFFAKSSYNLDSCGSYKCTGYEFLAEPKKKKTLSPQRLGSKISSHFISQGYQVAARLPIVNQTGSTLFTGTCGQVFDNAIFNEQEYKSSPLLAIQPVIRLQGKDLVGVTDGFSTSFVNIASEQMGASKEQHLQNLNTWLDSLSESGIYMGTISLVPVVGTPDWGGIKPTGLTLRINYLGLELGVSNYFPAIRQDSRDTLKMSDISFGLERLAWALSKTPSYFDVLGPLDRSAVEEYRKMDRIRTITLMLASHVTPSNKDRGSKLRSLAKDPSVGDKVDLELIEYYYNWWSNFIDLPASLTETVNGIRAEIYRNKNAGIQNKTGIKDIPLDIPTEEYLQQLLLRNPDIGYVKRLFLEK